MSLSTTWFGRLVGWLDDMVSTAAAAVCVAAGSFARKDVNSERIARNASGLGLITGFAGGMDINVH